MSKAGIFPKTELGLDDAGGAGNQVVGGGGGYHDKVDLVFIDTCIFESFEGRFASQIRGSFPLSYPSLLNACPRGDPLVGGINHFLKVGIC